MKKLILSLMAMLVFGIASAQTDPKKEVKKAGDIRPEKDPETEKVITDEPKQEMLLQQKKEDIRTEDHIKSTPDLKRKHSKDTVKTTRKRADRR